MKKFLTPLLLCSISLMAADFSIVKDGKPCAVIVQGRRSKSCTLAVKTLAECVEKATGAKLQIVRPAAAAKMDASLNRIYVGDTDYAKKQGVDSQKLKLEEYRVIVRNKEMFLYGHDKEDPEGRATGAPGTPHPMDARRYSPATLWAVNTVLEKFAGVKFLWPGDLGTYVPKTKNLSVPVGFTFQDRPYYARRQMWYGVGCRMKNFDGNTRFMLNHQQGSRINTWFTDGFQGWWEAYGKTKPEVIALSPEGKRTYCVKPFYVKLCISNPETQKIILDRWRAAGRPDTWSMCPNDGVGFCTCKNCRKWDNADAQKATAEQIWFGRKVNLTKRYVTLWNIIIDQMRKENPNAIICVFGYGAYKLFKTDGVKLHPGVLSAVVAGDFELKGAGKVQWDSWANSGAMLLLRPNWLNTFWFTPYFPLKKTAEFMRATQDKCAGYEHDTFGGCWPTQGLYCYMLVRMSYRLNLTVDDIKKEYASAFGKGAPAILKWIQYWEDYTDRLRGSVAEETDAKLGGLYDQICAKDKRIRPNILYGCWDALEASYPDSVMKPGYALLDEADKAIGSSDHEAKARVQFLRDGMIHVDKMKQVLSLWWKGANKPEFHKAFNELYEMRGRMEKDYVVNRHALMYNEFARRIRIVPVNADGSRQFEDVYVRDWMPKMKAEDAREK